MFWSFNNIDIGTKSVYYIYVLTAMSSTKKELKLCYAWVIPNCFTHCLNANMSKSDEKRVINSKKTLKSMV